MKTYVQNVAINPKIIVRQTCKFEDKDVAIHGNGISEKLEKYLSLNIKGLSYGK